MREVSFKNYVLKVASSIAEFNPAQWNSLVNEAAIPFLEWEWLAALEESGSTSPETGWHPFHLSLWKHNALLAAAPLYLKYHSEGEFVWDYIWIEAALSMGRQWYPKLVGTVPATPAEGYRFLVSGNEDAESLHKVLLDAAETICRANGIHGLHFLFTDPEWAQIPAGRGYGAWEHQRYIWENRNFTSFDDFLSILNKNQRKNIRREYGRHKEQDVGLRIVEHPPVSYFDKIHELYTITNDKFIPWDARWVNEAFFRHVGKNFSRRVVFSEAFIPDSAQNETLALAMMIRKNNRLWGRYWGAYGDVKDLHFAACYYAPMDYCVREEIRFFDPGAGSPHKIHRGFRAVFDRSYHTFFDPVLQKLFSDNIDAVNRYERENIGALNEELPFRKDKGAAEKA